MASTQAPPPPQPARPASKSTKATQALAPAGATAARSAAPTSPAIQPAAGQAANAAADDAEADAAFVPTHGDEAVADRQDDAPAQDAPDNSGVASQATMPGGLAPTATTNTPPPMATLASAHGADITAQLAAQITSKASAQRTAFDFALEPQGLGRVDVSLKFDAQGQVSAVLSFDNPNAATEAKSRAGDLQQALQQAGFDVSQSGLSFTSGGNQGQGAAWQTTAGASYTAGPSLADTTPDAAIASSISAARASSAGGLDITI